MIICFDVCVHNVGTYILHIVNDITIPHLFFLFLLFFYNRNNNKVHCGVIGNFFTKVSVPYWLQIRIII